MSDYKVPNYHYVFGEDQLNKRNLSKIIHNDGDGDMKKYILKHVDLFVLAICEKYGYSMRIIFDTEKKKIVHAYAVKKFLGETYYYDQAGLVEFKRFHDFFKNKKVKRENCIVVEIEDLEAYKTIHPYAHDKRKGLGYLDRKVQLMKCYLEHTFRIMDPIHYEACRIIERAGWKNLKTTYGRLGEMIIEGSQIYLGNDYSIKAEVYKDIYYGMITYYEVKENGKLQYGSTLKRYLELEEEMASWLNINAQKPFTFGLVSERDQIEKLLAK